MTSIYELVVQHYWMQSMGSQNQISAFSYSCCLVRGRHRCGIHELASVPFPRNVYLFCCMQIKFVWVRVVSSIIYSKGYGHPLRSLCRKYALRLSSWLYQPTAARQPIDGQYKWFIFMTSATLRHKSFSVVFRIQDGSQGVFEGLHTESFSVGRGAQLNLWVCVYPCLRTFLALRMFGRRKVINTGLLMMWSGDAPSCEVFWSW